MQLVLVQGLGSVVALFLFVLLAAPDGNPLGRVVAAGRNATALSGGRLAIAAIVVVIVVNYVEGTYDPALTRLLGWDATGLVHALEGDLVGRLQAAIPSPLVLPLALVYVPGYLAILNAPLLIWTSPADRPIAARYAVAFVLNYAVALPFFLFAPVREVGWSGLTTARPLLDTVWPGITAQLRAGSPLDNCFPSMHVSCVVTTLFHVQKHGPPGLRRVAWVVVPAIVLSTMALGIHWFCDVVAGVAVAIGCTWAADRWLTRRSVELEAHRRGIPARTWGAR